MTARAWVEREHGLRLLDDGAPVGLAVRSGGQRRHLLVSEVLAKHVPVDPRRVVHAAEALGLLVRETLGPSDGVPLVVGLAETATGLAAQVARTLGCGVICTTRLAAAQDRALCRFPETHSHAVWHSLAPEDEAVLRSPGTLVVVDDELSTGRTAAALVAELDALAGPRRYVVATLLDARGESAPAGRVAVADERGLRIDVVALHHGVVVESLGAATVGAEGHSGPSGALTAGGQPAQAERRASTAGVRRETLHLSPGAVAARDGLAAARLVELADAAQTCGADLARIARHHDSVHVLGLEEGMDLPLHVALGLSRALPTTVRVTVSSTTRSPIRVVDDPGYPVRTALTFPAAERGSTGDRYVYGLARTGLMVLVVDPTTDLELLEGPGALIDRLAANSDAVLVLQVASDPDETVRPLAAPTFSTYPRTDVEWLVTDLSAVPLERPVEERESAARTGHHYSESLPVEYVPSARYAAAADLAAGVASRDTALAVGVVAERVLATVGRRAVLLSLARAGVPAGIWIRRWTRTMHGHDLPHLAISVIHDVGVDTAALEYVLDRYDADRLVLVDGWTGKGTIADTLAESMPRTLRGAHRPPLAVLADPARRADIAGSREDLLVPTACYNATSAGLVSRTVLPPGMIPHDRPHGAKFYAQRAVQDRSAELIAGVEGWFAQVADVARAAAAAPQVPPEPGWAAERLTDLRRRVDIGERAQLKAGVGEATRALLRRLTACVLVREADDPLLAHLRVLAEERGVPVRVVDTMDWRAVAVVERP